MDFIIQVFAWILMLGIISTLVIVHEFGHFIVARIFGFQTPVFGVGLPFGPSWTVGKQWGTEFRLHACLLGGYVAIPELGDESSFKNQDEVFGVELQPFRKFPIWQRALVAFAGPGFNIIFAYLIMLVMLFYQGIPTYQTVVHSLIKANPIALNAGVKADDRILSIDSKKISTPDEAVNYLSSRKGQEVTLHIQRDEKPSDIKLTTSPDGKVGMVLIVKGPVTYEKVNQNIIEVFGMAGQRLYDLTASMIEALKLIVKGIWTNIVNIGHPKEAAPSVGIQDVHGILAVLKIGAEIARQDWNQLFMFTILISMDLAIINLVPFPPLDGYHLASQTIEAVRGRPMSERVQGEIIRFGWVTIFILFAVIMVNDVTALFTGKLDLKKAEEKESRRIDEKVKEATTKEQSAPPVAKPDTAEPNAEPAESSSENQTESK